VDGTDGLISDYSSEKDLTSPTRTKFRKVSCSGSFAAQPGSLWTKIYIGEKLGPSMRQYNQQNL
jgi:hypothetical protein